MIWLHLFSSGAVCLILAWIIAGIWAMGMDTYAERLVWVLPPLAFAFAITGLYLWFNLVLYCFGFPVEVT